MAREPYRPSNNTEGAAFLARWCNQCTRDDVHDEPCPIKVSTIFLKVTDPDYPQEWVRGAAGPCCTAFEATDADVDRRIEDERQGALFA
jgi:hypothetical protein